MLNDCIIADYLMILHKIFEWVVIIVDDWLLSFCCSHYECSVSNAISLVLMQIRLIIGISCISQESHIQNITNRGKFFFLLTSKSTTDKVNSPRHVHHETCFLGDSNFDIMAIMRMSVVWALCWHWKKWAVLSLSTTNTRKGSWIFDDTLAVIGTQ